MRRSAFGCVVIAGLAAACASTNNGFTEGGGAGGHGGGGGIDLNGDAGGGDGSGGSAATVIYANTDTALYSMDPATKTVNLVGPFVGMGGGSGDDTVTDLAVNAAGDIYVNTETVVYRVTLPSGAGAGVELTRVATIATSDYQSFYALAFAPPGLLGSGEMLVGGDGNGEVWSIDPATGATQDLGSFGPDPSDTYRTFGLSGDIVFYTDAAGKATGLATIRSCDNGGSCDKTNDYLAGIDVDAMVAAYTSHAPAASLLAGIYGGGSGSAGAGTGYGELFGLGAWEGDVYAFSRAGSGGSPPPELVLVDTGTGRGGVVPSSAGFTSGGWSGAGVSTRTVVTVAPPPPK